jgi:hypothetical protein
MIRMSIGLRVIVACLVWLTQVSAEFISEFPGQYNYRMGMTYCSLCSYNGLLGGVYTHRYYSSYRGLLKGNYNYGSTYLP